jgi:hypothetical protein
MIGVWNSNNIGGSLKRGVGIGMQVGMGNLGGIIAAFVYQAKDEPRSVLLFYDVKHTLVGHGR